MCRRSGRGGLAAGEAWAVGTIGLLDAPDAAKPFNEVVQGVHDGRRLSNRDAPAQ